MTSAPMTPAGTLDDDTGDCIAFAILMGRKIHERLRKADLRAFEPVEAGSAVETMQRGVLREVSGSVGEAMQLIANLPVLVYGSPLPEPEEDDGLDFDAFDDAFSFDDGAPATEGVPSPPPEDRFDEEVDAALHALTRDAIGDPEGDGVVWRMLIDQLAQARERLQGACRSRCKWSMITEGEDAKRRTVKSLEYALTLASRALDPDRHDPILPDAETLLETSLAVRDLLLAFRRDVLAVTCDLDDRPDRSLPGTARDIRTRLTNLFFDSTYELLRANDRYQLQQLFQRLDGWLGDGADEARECRQILADIHAFADLLASVNRRAILEEHDRRVAAACRDGLTDAAAVASVSREDAWLRYADLLLDVETLGWRLPAAGFRARAELARGGDDDLVERIELTRALIDDIHV